eukprot:jgi/Phyca11/21968/fgenesh1_pg.PHYCAscaffold_292_\
MTLLQQRIVVDALLVEGQGDEFLIDEDWMGKHQSKMDFRTRELKFVNEREQKVIIQFSCHVCMKVDAEDGTSGVFVPKPSSKRHLMLATTTDTVKDGRREKLLARGYR